MEEITADILARNKAIQVCYKVYVCYTFGRNAVNKKLHDATERLARNAAFSL